MNNKGISTVSTIILIPIFIVVSVLISDTCINIYYEKKFKEATKEVITDLIENDVNEEKLESRASITYQEYNFDTEFLLVELTESNKIKIYNSTKHYSVIDSFFKKGKRQITIKAEGYKNGNDIIIDYLKDDE